MDAGTAEHDRAERVQHHQQRTPGLQKYRRHLGTIPPIAYGATLPIVGGCVRISDDGRISDDVDRSRAVFTVGKASLLGWHGWCIEVALLSRCFNQTLPSEERTKVHTSPHVSAGTEGSANHGLSPSDTTTSTSSTSSTSSMERAPWKAVYCVAERGKGRRLWLRIGTAFPNRDGSLTIRLDALPLSGQLQVREPFASGPRDGSGDQLLGDRAGSSAT